MKIMIVEDDVTSSKLLQRILSPHGDCTICIDGEEAVHAFRLAWDEGAPYDLICMDIMMPNMDGKQALLLIRAHEREMGINEADRAKVVMVTAVDDSATVLDSFYRCGATSYIVKPITKGKLMEVIGWDRVEPAAV